MQYTSHIGRAGSTCPAYAALCHLLSAVLLVYTQHYQPESDLFPEASGSIVPWFS